MNGPYRDPCSSSPPEDRLKVLFVAGCWYPHDEQPFQGVFIRRHAEAVADSHQVAVLHPLDLADGPQRAGVHTSRHGSIQQIQVRFKPGALPGQSQMGFYRAGRTGAQAVLGHFGRPDIVHFHVVPSAGLTLGVLSAFPGVPVVLTEHWSGYMPESGVTLSRLRRLYTGLLVRRAKVVTTVSDHHRKAMARLGFRGNFTVVPNVVDTEIFCPATQRSPGPFRLIHVSGLRPEKRSAEIVQVAAGVIRQGLDLELHIVGEGPEGDRCRTIAASEGLLGRGIFFHGRLDEAEVARQTGLSDGSVLFSRFENSPCVIGEALACGIPMVASRVGGIPEHISPDRGILVQPGDREALEEALAALVRRGRTWNSEAFRAYAENTFSPETIRVLFNRVYRQTLGIDPAIVGE